MLPSHSKENALEAVRLLEETGSEGVLCIVDADYWHMDGGAPTSGNVIPTDRHDIEVDIICSRALDRFLREYGSKTKTQSFVSAEENKPLSEILLTRLLPLGHLRRLSLLNNFSLRFEGLKFRRFVDPAALLVDIDALVSHVLNLTRDSSIDEGSLLSKLAEAVEDAIDAEQCCCGHDVVELLSLGLRRALGSQRAAVSSVENLARALRLAFDWLDLSSMRMFRLVTAWEEANPPYVVFSPSH